MSRYAKMVKKRDRWRTKTKIAKTQVHYISREIRRVKRERDQYKKDLRETRKALEELKQQRATPAVCNKTGAVFLALQLFLVARISFRAVSRVLAVFAPLASVVNPAAGWAEVRGPT